MQQKTAQKLARNYHGLTPNEAITSQHRWGKGYAGQRVLLHMVYRVGNRIPGIFFSFRMYKCCNWINGSPVGPSTPMQPCRLLLEIQSSRFKVSIGSSNLQAKGASHYHLFHSVLSPHINNYSNMIWVSPFPFLIQSRCLQHGRKVRKSSAPWTT